MVDEEIEGRLTASPIVTFSAPDGASEVCPSALCRHADQDDVELGCQQSATRTPRLQLLFRAACLREQFRNVVVELSQPIMMLQDLLENVVPRPASDPI